MPEPRHAYPEPLDGSTVGWGPRPADLRRVYQRNDDIEVGNAETERWWLVDDYSGMGDNPTTWALIVEHCKGWTPYLLTPTPLAGQETPA